MKIWLKILKYANYQTLPFFPYIYNLMSGKSFLCKYVFKCLIAIEMHRCLLNGAVYFTSVL